MKRRLIAAAVALVLAASGALVILGYVAKADRRAMAGMETRTVLVAAQDIPKGTPAADLRPMVKTRLLPAVAVAPAAVDSLGSLAGRVSTVDLSAGEQLLRPRFADPAAADIGPLIPPGLQELTLKLDSQRVLGGQLRAGDKVGVFLSTDFKDHPRTHLKVNQVLVTKVVGGTAQADGDGGGQQAGPGAAAGAADTVTVSLAVSAPQAERIVFAAEHGTVWLSRQNPKTSAAGRTVITERNLYR